MIENLDHLYDSFSNIQYNDDGQDFIIGYSINYIIYDIFQILWMQTAMPWSDKKFEKRIERICALNMYSYIRNQFYQELNRIHNNNIPPNVNITVEQFNQIIQIINQENKWRKYDIIMHTLDRLNQFNYNTNQNAYMNMIEGVIRYFFKNPEIILNKQLLFKLNEKNFIDLLECTDAYADIGVFMTTVLHYIYNKFLIDTSTPEDIYNFYYNIAIRSNFLITDNLNRYFGKRINNGNITYVPPQNPQEIHVINDVKNYLDRYLQIIRKWVIFFGNFIFRPDITDPNKISIAQILIKKISILPPNAQHGGKTRLRNLKSINNNKKTLKKHSKQLKGGAVPLSSIYSGPEVLPGTGKPGIPGKPGVLEIPETQKIQPSETNIPQKAAKTKTTINTEQTTELFEIPIGIINEHLSNLKNKEKMDNEFFWNIEFNDFKLFSPTTTQNYRKHNFGMYHNDTIF
jgi:hypothetical protein